jgi:hypothetical protein
MSKLQHTPGPWVFTGSMHKKAYLVNGGDKYICSVWDHLREDDNGHPIDMDKEMQSNARLIAAAPEMLEALIEQYKWLYSKAYYQTAELLKLLIEKATGMSIEEVLSQ